MDTSSIPIMTALKERMGWLVANQKVISENVAHADTPGYMAKSLEQQDFSTLVDRLADDRGVTRTTMRVTNERHIGAAVSADTARVSELKDSETTPDGNSVVLEDEMIKLANTQMEYGLVTSLYRKNIGLMKLAAGRRAGG